MELLRIDLLFSLGLHVVNSMLKIIGVRYGMEIFFGNDSFVYDDVILSVYNVVNDVQQDYDEKMQQTAIVP